MRSFKQWLVDWLYPALERKRALREWHVTRNLPRCSACDTVIAENGAYCPRCGTLARTERHTTGGLAPVATVPLPHVDTLVLDKYIKPGENRFLAWHRLRKWEEMVHGD